MIQKPFPRPSIPGMLTGLCPPAPAMRVLAQLIPCILLCVMVT